MKKTFLQWLISEISKAKKESKKADREDMAFVRRGECADDQVIYRTYEMRERCDTLKLVKSKFKEHKRAGRL